MNQENNNLVDEIFKAINQEVDFRKDFVIDGDNSIENKINDAQLFEAVRIYNIIKEVVNVNKERFNHIKNKQNLTLTEAIIHARHIEQCSDLDENCKVSHRQLADWLEELRDFRRKAMEDEILNPKLIDTEEKE